MVSNKSANWTDKTHVIHTLIIGIKIEKHKNCSALSGQTNNQLAMGYHNSQSECLHN